MTNEKLNLIKLDENDFCENIGNKAKFLIELKNNSYNVPDGFVLSSEIFDEFLKDNKLEDAISDMLNRLDKSNVNEINDGISALYKSAKMPDYISAAIEESIDPNTNYAVRSSCLQEDMPEHSFAGQYSTILNVNGINNINKAIITCYQSMYSEVVLSYLLHNNVAMGQLKMAVLIQEMVDSDISGIAFTVNPMTGNDKEIVVEAACGLGESIVSGKVTPERYIYNWYDGRYEGYDNKLLNDEMLSEMMNCFLSIQIHFGYPCDIEFAINNDALYILQARPITKIMYAGIKDQWTTADFKDGGVSATVCYPFMWSLYEYIWENTFREYLNKAVLVNKKHLKNLGDMFFGRPYWNLTKTKLGMAKVIGYKEINFDHELGVKVTYKGNGVTTKVSLASIINVLRIFIRNKRNTVDRLKKNQSFKDDLLAIYEDMLKQKDKEMTLSEIEQLWQKLIWEQYFKSESTYFSQIFINTIGQAIYKETFKKYVSDSGYLNLMSGLQDISHLRPFHDIWDISRKIRNDANALCFWQKSTVQKIKIEYDEGSSDYYIDLLREHIEKFGYHSDKELDVTYPHYAEDAAPVISSLKEIVLLGDDSSPLNDQIEQQLQYKDEISKLAVNMKPSKYKRVVKQIEEMRKMLWWREELRDISTKYYFLIRLFSIKLAACYVQQGVINNADDIWYLKIKDLNKYIEKEYNVDTLKKIINRNKKYYESFRNFNSENEIGHVFDNSAVEPANTDLKGIGCNNGIVTGVARVVKDFSEMDKIQTGDILITKFTDTGWTSKFAVLKGIVTEYGGTLCHSAIVSREYGIPCIVSAVNATKEIKDGSVITINGTNGSIKFEKD